MFKIRYADINDAEELGKIHSSSWKIAYKGIVPDEILENITVEKRQIGKKLNEYRYEKILSCGGNSALLNFFINSYFLPISSYLTE